MRMLFINHNVAWSGGTFFRAYHLARFLVRRGHHVTLLTISPQRRFGFQARHCEGVRVVESPDLLVGSARSGWDPWDTLRRAGFVRRETADLVHAFDSRPAVILPALVAARRGTPLVLDWADWWGRGGTIEERNVGATLRVVVRPLETYFEEAFRTQATATTVISSALERRAQALGVPPDSIERIPGGCDTERVTPRSKHDCRHGVGADAERPLFGYLGVLTRGDAELLWRTFDRLQARRPDARLVLIGNHKARLPLRNGMIATGFVPFDQMVTWLGACDVLLLPLRDTIASRGRWPSKLNDYLAAGRPVVTTRVGDVQDLFAHHEIGRAVADDPEAMAEACAELIGDCDILESLGQNARRVAELDLSWSRLAERLEAHHMRAMARAGSNIPSA